ncbi:hypothetical protein BDW74DRAFT_183110 [Aspergillus multicolor]|uniref:uncharacterized protein n=1 Tax=Aspergillus multicolor TaxID=41759 RepID=UPI003CCCDB19
MHTLVYLLAYYAIHHGDTKQLESILKAGNDVTRRSFRFRIWPFAETGTVANPDIAALLTKHGLPLLFNGTSTVTDTKPTYHINTAYVTPYIEAANLEGLKDAVSSLRSKFRGLMWRVVKGALANAEKLQSQAGTDPSNPINAETYADLLSCIEQLRTELERERWYMIRDCHPDTVCTVYESEAPPHVSGAQMADGRWDAVVASI